MIADIQQLRAAIAAGQFFDYLFFWGHTVRKGEASGSTCLSQWYPAAFTVNGVEYPTAEHWMMAAKARLFGDEATLAEILAAPTPAAAKKLGRKVAGFNSELWTAKNFEIVTNGNVHKFDQNPGLKEFLLGTGDRVLVEASPVDPIWGIGLAADHADAPDPEKWRGRNLLGFALMVVRERLRAAS